MRAARAWALAAACAAALGALGAAASRVSLLVVDLPEQRQAWLVGRSTLPGLRAVDSADALCRRQQPGSPLRSIYLDDAFCQRAVALAVDAGGAVRLPLAGSLLASDRR